MKWKKERKKNDSSFDFWANVRIKKKELMFNFILWNDRNVNEKKINKSYLSFYLSYVEFCENGNRLGLAE